MDSRLFKYFPRSLVQPPVLITKMANNGIIDEPMEIETLPSTSSSYTTIKQKDAKSLNLPWYVVFLSEVKSVLNFYQG